MIYAKKRQKLTLSRSSAMTYLVKISDSSQAFADNGIEFRIVVQIPDTASPGFDPIKRAKQVARDAVNERWQKIRPGSRPVAMQCFAVEAFSGDVENLTPGYKPYRSPYGDRGWIFHAPHALAAEKLLRLMDDTEMWTSGYLDRSSSNFEELVECAKKVFGKTD